jgi:predicted DCC family thiol-disulfide oxidoreductase YuxK
MNLASEPRLPSRGWILYDGACGICSRLAVKAAPFLDRLGLNVIPLQSPWAQEVTGLTSDQLLSDIRLVHRDGRVLSGPDVYRHVMRQVWWARPVYLLSVAPGLRSAFDWGYRAFARHRMRFSVTCTTPAESVDVGRPHG